MRLLLDRVWFVGLLEFCENPLLFILKGVETCAVWLLFMLWFEVQVPVTNVEVLTFF